MDKLKEFVKTGDIFIWFTGFGLGMILVMIAGLMLLILINGSDYYYPSLLARVNLNDGKSSGFPGEQ